MVRAAEQNPVSTVPVSEYPTSPEDWEARPYFLWDTDMTWRQFRACLASSDDVVRQWALARLLDEAYWPDIRRLAPIEALERDLPELRVKHPHFWRKLVEVARESS